ncbi:tetratricopeptide repeat protein, partial [Campylobacter coli]
RALLADHYAAVDADLPVLLDLLFARSAGEDWHKAGTFKHHLLGVYRTLTLWNQPREVRLLGLFHSVYGNEYVDLTLFD